MSPGECLETHQLVELTPMKSYFLVICIVAMTPFSLAGCGGTDYASKCGALCDGFEACADNDTSADEIDSIIAECKSTCEKNSDIVDASGCDSEADTYLDCNDSRDNQCTADASCNDELGAVNNCIQEYCTDNGDDKACIDLASSGKSRDVSVSAYALGFGF
ncbi:MAG: hypothetical protein H7Z43_05305 [Clostridia bacterium]|nr:hypothetical protein [Deltaproteobacteria bacterium]